MGEDTKNLIKLICLPISDLAEALGVPYDTVRSWSSGRADPSPENVEALVRFIEEHAEKLMAEANKLEGREMMKVMNRRHPIAPAPSWGSPPKS